MEFLWQTKFWRIYGSGREQCLQFLLERTGHLFLTSCASVNTPSPFELGLKRVWKRKVLTALDFQFISHFFFFLLFFSDMTEKQQQMKALTLFFCMQNALCINADCAYIYLCVHISAIELSSIVLVFSNNNENPWSVNPVKTALSAVQ